MAKDMIHLMTSTLGFDGKISILAHDRGARVAHRLALDYGDKVDKMVMLDIAPTLWMYEHTNMAFVSLGILTHMPLLAPSITRTGSKSLISSLHHLWFIDDIPAVVHH